MSDITERLRQGFFSPVATKVAAIAAEEIDRLRADLKQSEAGELKNALAVGQACIELQEERKENARIRAELAMMQKGFDCLAREREELRAALAEAQRDAERYRWMRNRNNSLETRQYDLRVYNGPSCYHEVGGIRELKSESNLDAAIDAAILATKEGKKDE